MRPTRITRMVVKDVRFPTSLDGLGDAMNKQDTLAGECFPVSNRTNTFDIVQLDTVSLFNLSFQRRRCLKVHAKRRAERLTIQVVAEAGRYNVALQRCSNSGVAEKNILKHPFCFAIKTLQDFVVGRNLGDIFGNLGAYWREITSDPQLRWIGPEKGVQHLATAAVVNALWDIWAKKESKPLWKLLVDMDPELLVNTIDFRYITDVLTKEEAIKLLTKMDETKEHRVEDMYNRGYPCYITSVGWMGFSDEKIVRLTTDALAKGYSRLKMKVGVDIEDDKRRASILRKTIGYDKILCVDANQKWDVDEAIDWMKELVPYKPHWIEEPTSPDDVLGHASLAQELKPYGIRVATGEMCQNRVMFKQFLQAGGLQFCQIDAGRLGGVNEVLAVLLMAAKFNVPVCPHSGGVGLCELVQHYALFDYIRCSGTHEDRMTEYVDELHEHMKSPCVVENGNYKPPAEPGFLIGMKEETLSDYEYPNGRVWQQLFDKGKFQRLSSHKSN